MKRNLFFAVSLMGLFIISNCNKKSSDNTTYDCTGVKPTYTNDVKSIMDASCATSGCHNASSKKEGIDLSSYSGVKSAASSKNFLGSIQHTKGYSTMPKDGNKLSEDKIKIISCWVQNSMPE